MKNQNTQKKLTSFQKKVNLYRKERNKLILQYLLQGLNQQQISSKLGVSKVAICKSLQRLQDAGFISKYFRSSYNVWRVNDKVITEVNQFLGASERKNLLEVDFHSYGYKFKILKDNKKVNFQLGSRLNNWTEQKGEYKGYIFRRTTKHLEFMLKQRQTHLISNGDMLLKLKEKYLSNFINVAIDFSNKFGIELDAKNPLKFRKEIKIKHHDKLKKICKGKRFYDTIMKNVYPDDSIHNGVEFYDEVDAKNVLNNLALQDKSDIILESIYKIIQVQQNLVNLQDGYRVAIQKHLEAVSKIADGMDKFTKNVDYLDNKQKEFERKVKKVIGEVI